MRWGLWGWGWLLEVSDGDCTACIPRAGRERLCVSAGRYWGGMRRGTGAFMVHSRAQAGRGILGKALFKYPLWTRPLSCRVLTAIAVVQGSLAHAVCLQSNPAFRWGGAACAGVCPAG